MPKDNRGNDYYEKSSGTNTEGNKWSSRNFGEDAPNQNAYRYSNQDGSFYYNNADNSKYYNDGKGKEEYTKPDGSGWKSKDGQRSNK